mmetsp:Transcript_13755/g.32101  ORF Transcript_13755/g.32101 Transcript_13755/m.32101 type:complete len:125 (+) Transcript_13755:89-463(+)
MVETEPALDNNDVVSGGLPARPGPPCFCGSSSTFIVNIALLAEVEVEVDANSASAGIFLPKATILVPPPRSVGICNVIAVSDASVRKFLLPVSCPLNCPHLYLEDWGGRVVRSTHTSMSCCRGF